MSLRRRDIRDAVITALLNQTDCDDRVYPNRERSIPPENLPCVLVNTKNETVDVYSESGPRTYKRTLSLDLIILAEADDDIDEELDILGAQVEARMVVDHSLGELCQDVILRSNEVSIVKEGDNLRGSLTLGFEVIYYSEPVNDSSTLEWLNRVDVEYAPYDFNASAEHPTDIIDGLSAL